MKTYLFRCLAVLVISLAMGVIALPFPLNVDADPVFAAVKAAPHQPAQPLLSDIQAIAVGGLHTCVLTTGGWVKCWGENGAGQVGDETTTRRSTPADVIGLTNVRAIAAGATHTCALTLEGGVKCWGLNLYGRLGDGTDSDRLTPVDVVGLDSGVQAIAAGGGHTCALTVEGGVKCWGWGEFGQLGHGTNSSSNIPVEVDGLSSNVQAIAVGGEFTCALTVDGGVKCWGRNDVGQLGDGTNSFRSIPVDVVGLDSGVQSIEAGGVHTCALTINDDAKCWGGNDHGQLGDGTYSDRLTPVDVSWLSSGIQAIVAGGLYTCTLTVNGGLKCWGWDEFGQLGNGTTMRRSAPVDVIGLSSGVQVITAGFVHSCALMTSGGVKCWGANENGQLGDGTYSDRPTPVDVTGLNSGVQAIAAGSVHTCALMTSGGVKCWGQNHGSQLGNGANLASSIPVDVFGLSSGAQAIAVGWIHSCALTMNGAVQCWGGNHHGQLGDGTTVDRITPVDVIGLSGVQAIAVGGAHSCALTAGGEVKCWGRNYYGQLGDGTTADRVTPVDVIGLSGVQAIAAGGAHTCALTAGGEIKCWGENSSGALGDGTATDRSIPVDVVGLSSDVQAIAAGGDHTCALTGAGGVQCWGWNLDGQLGDGTTSRRSAPVDVVGLSSGAQAISAGLRHTCVLATDTGVKCWGGNGFGQTGDGTYTSRLTPVDVIGFDNGVQAIAAGVFHSCALTIDGGVKCWGRNEAGQLGVNPGWAPVDVVAGPPVRGRVLDIALRPIADAVVTYAEPAEQLVTLSTDAAGVFTISTSGHYTVTVEKPGYSIVPDVIHCPMPPVPCQLLFIGAQSPDAIPLTFLPSVKSSVAEGDNR